VEFPIGELDVGSYALFHPNLLADGHTNQENDINRLAP
jgi:hypothetical protein